MFERYIARLVNRERKPVTIANFRRAVTQFSIWLREEGIAAADVTEDDIETYFSPTRFPHGQSTRRLHAVQVKAAYSYAFRRGWVKTDPFVDFELPKEPDPDPTVLSSEDLRAMRKRCRHWKDETLWSLLVYSGLRRDELRRLSWEEIDLDGMTISTVGKGGKHRTVPVHPSLAELLERAPDGNAHTVGEKHGAVLWNPTTRKHYGSVGSFERIKDHIAPESGFHIFRRTVATSLADNNVSGDVIDKIMGWAPVGIRARYYVKTKDESLHRAILRLYADDPLA
jgi:integrase